jgi:hypothetical protein
MDDNEREQRKRVCAIARSWIGTPFADNGEVKGPNGGVDCARLLRLTFVEAGLIESIKIPDYSPQWFLHQSEEKFLVWVMQLGGREIPEAQAIFGDIVVYKMGHCYAHGAIIIEPGWPAIVHSYFQARRVVRSGGLDGQLGRAKHVRKFFSRWASG